MISRSNYQSNISVPTFVGGLIGAAAIGAAAVFLFDPVMGAGRRREINQKLSDLGRDIADRADQITHQAVKQAQGIVSEVRDSGAGRGQKSSALLPDADETLVDRSMDGSGMGQSMSGQSMSGQSMSGQSMVNKVRDAQSDLKGPEVDLSGEGGYMESQFDDDDYEPGQLHS